MAQAINVEDLNIYYSEFLAVEKGRVRVESGGDTDELGPGDSASYPADVPHAIINAGKAEAVLFLVDIYR